MRALVGLGMAMALLASQSVAQPAWAQAQWDLAEKKSGQEARDLRDLLKRQGLTD